MGQADPGVEDAPPGIADGTARPGLRARIARSRHVDQAFVAATTIFRLGVSLGTFMALARSLGPADFGLVVTAFAYASVAIILTDYGFGLQALRDIGAAPGEAGRIMTESLRAKVALAVVVTLAFAPALLLVDWTATALATIVLLFLATQLTSFGDLTLVTLRALGEYRRETWIVGYTTALHAGLIALALVLGHGTVAVGVAFLVSRSIYLGVAVAAVSRRTDLAGLFRPTMQGIVARLKGSSGFAVDSVLTMLSTQIDTIMVSRLLGLEAAGLYQSVARFAQIAPTFSMVVSSIHIPKLARARVEGGAGRGLRRLFADYGLLALLLGIGFGVVGPLVAIPILGPAYEGVRPLWAGFAAMVVVHILASAFGACLIVTNAIRVRIAGAAAALVVSTLLYLLFLTRTGLDGAPWFLAAGEATKLAIYVAAAWIGRPAWRAPAADPARGVNGSA